MQHLEQNLYDPLEFFHGHQFHNPKPSNNNIHIVFKTSFNAVPSNLISHLEKAAT